MSGYEILEHTADVGVRARGATLEETFENAIAGLADIMGIVADGDGRAVPMEVQADDLGGLLVELLGEVLYLHEVHGGRLAGARVTTVGDGRVRASISLAPDDGAGPDGTDVKAITYHQLAVERSGDGWVAQVYVDV